MIKRILLLACALALAVCLIACSNGGDDEAVTTAPDDSTAADSAAETTSGTEEETTVLPADDKTLDLTGYRVAVSDYASDHELELAEKLAGLLGTEIVKDTDVTDGKAVYVGWTSAVSFDLDSLGNAGYMADMIDGKLAVAANNAEGVEKIMEYIKDNLSSDKKFPMDKLTKMTGSTAEKTGYAISGSMSASVGYAQSLENAITEAFVGDGSRSSLDFSNQTMKLKYQLTGESAKYVTRFTNANGDPYFVNSSDVFVTNTDGVKLYASDSSSNGRMNTYRMGYYYRDIHVLDQNFVSGDNGGADKTMDVLAKVKKCATNMTSDVTKNDDGSIYFTVEDPTDPYITLTNASFNTADYNALKIVMRTQKSTSAEIYYVSGSHSGFSSEQRIGFGVTPGDQFCTYIISFDGAVDYTGKLKNLRIDVGTIGGELIEIQSIEAIHVNYYTAGVKLDRTYHTYSDKLNEELHFVVTKETDALASYGVETVIDASRVKGIVVSDKNGTHDSLTGVDFASVDYVGFDIVRAGVIGWIKCVDTDEAKFNVTLADGKYTVTLATDIPAGTSFKYGDELYLGYRVYNDATHSFDGLTSEAYTERHPLTGIEMLSTDDNARYLGYDALRGCYTFKVKGTDFNIYYKDKQRNFRISASISGDNADRKIYVLGAGESGCLENAVLLDENELLLPMALEVCKNFKGENEEPLFDAGDAEYGEVVFPLVIGAHNTETFNLIHLYTNWGQFPIKQLSSIQFIAPYYHLSCGTTESNCIAPYYVYGKDYWTLPDFRAMSAPFWSGQPQHTSIGRLHWLSYTNADNKFYGSEPVKDTIDSYGPTYADINMDYISEDGKIRASYRHVEMPQYDENRTFYEVKLEVLDDISINDFKNNFSLFNFDGRDKLFRKLGYLDESNQCVTRDIDLSEPFSEFITLGTEGAYFDYYMSDGDYVNFALLIKSAKITLNGKACDKPFVIKNAYDGALNYCYLTLDLGDVTLKKGDTFEINMLLLPWGSQLVSNDQSVRTVREDSCLNPVKVSAEQGSVVADEYVPKVRAENNTAIFTVSDGGSVMTARVYGFDGYGRPQLFEKVNGEWVEYDTSHYAYDGYMTYYDGDGTFSYSFCFDMSGGSPRTFKVVGGK